MRIEGCEGHINFYSTYADLVLKFKRKGVVIGGNKTDTRTRPGVNSGFRRGGWRRCGFATVAAPIRIIDSRPKIRILQHENLKRKIFRKGKKIITPKIDFCI